LDIRDLRHDSNVRIELEAEARVELECRFRGGKGYGKGQGKGKGKDFSKRIWLDLDGVENISRHKIKGGRLELEIDTDYAKDELDRYWSDYGCSGKNWERKVEQVQFHSARLTVKQGKRTVVDWVCDFDPPTRNGDVSRKDVECHRVD